MPAPLLDRRLHVVVGKGGVGKTTVAAALALLFARGGRRTLAIEMDFTGHLPVLLGAAGPALAPQAVSRNLHVLSVEGRAALEEYLGLVIPVKRLLHTVFSSRIYQYFVAAAPGLKELMTVGKIWYEATRSEGGRPSWDAIVVDAPATGHSLQYLRMPQAARDTFGAGLVQREAAKIVGLLQDAATTAVHLVTLAEEMPVAETLETAEQLRDVLQMPLGWVVVNRLHRRSFPADVVAALEAAPPASHAAERPLLACIAERAVEESGWAAINQANLARLRSGVADAPLIELPLLFVEEFGAPQLAQLSAVFEAALATPAATVAGRRS
jgi:anion-transporting  ArsA/GET3 family ATPase